MRVVRGTISGVPAGEMADLVLEADSEGEDGLRVVRPDGRGRFAVSGLPEATGVRITVRSSRSHEVLGSVDVSPRDAEVIIRLAAATGGVVGRLGDIVRRVAERDETDETRRSLIASQVSGAGSHRAVARKVAELVTKDEIARRVRPDQRTWLVPAGHDVRERVTAAAEHTLQDLAARPLAVRASASRLAPNDRLAAAALTSAVTGVNVGAAGLVRRDLLTLEQNRSEHIDPNGLPAPLATAASAGNGASNGASNGGGEMDAEGLIGERLRALVDAMRLPEDPPLVTASAAVGGDGRPVSLQGGPSQVPAVHDFHELRIAMPDVWQLRDGQLIETVEGVAEELAAAGVDIANIVQTADQGELLRALVDTATDYETAVRTTPVGAVARKVDPFQDVRHADSLLRHSNTVAVNDPWGPGGRVDRPSPPPDGDVEDTGSDDACDHDDGYLVDAPNLLEDLRSYLTGDHPFTVYAADGADRALNFGLLVTWRQRWDPVTYQTGDIVSTMTLAPAETRKIVTKSRHHRKRHTAEVEKGLRHRRTESADTIRAETEILRTAQATSNFDLSAEGTTNLLVTDGTFTTAGSRNKVDTGNDTRKRFRDAVRKASQEYRDEHSLEVVDDDEMTVESETTAEIRNPNDELAMTAVLYELSRRYRVHEQLYRARPVVLVAMPVPQPSQITDAWLVRYDWILRRSLLDDSFLSALRYLSASYVGDAHELARLRQAEATHRNVLTKTQEIVASHRAAARRRAAALERLRRDLAGDGGDGSDILDAVPGIKLARDAVSWLGDMLSDDDEEAQRRNQSLLAAAEQALDRADREAADAGARLDATTSAYQEVVSQLAVAEARAANATVDIARLRVHVRDNLLHYMQAIWAHQPPDQRYFELHTVEVPVLDGEVTIQGALPSDGGVIGMTSTQFAATFTRDGAPVTTRPLAEVADLDQLLGFKGNYAVFPLREQNAITSLLLAPLLDADEMLSDPTDPAANWTLTELRAYADVLRTRVAAGALSDTEFDTVYAPWLRSVLERLVSDPDPVEEEIVVPSGSVYMELITSGANLIEKFKQEHRALDVALVRAQIRRDELENLRRAARLDQHALADPDMDDFERHLVQSAGSGVAPPP